MVQHAHSGASQRALFNDLFDSKIAFGLDP